MLHYRSPDAFLVCNDYKDEAYISLALLGRRLNLNTVIVLEQEVLDAVIETSKKTSSMIGLRAKIQTKHSSHFGSTSGEKRKVGLTTNDVDPFVLKVLLLQANISILF